MVVYAIFLERIPKVITSPAMIRAHIAHLRDLDQRGALVLCGPFTDHPGGLVVVRAEDRAAAERIAAADPFVREGVRTYSIRTWQLATADNGYLGR